MRIAGSVALVTGASSGIGEAVAVDLARRGATVVVTARRGNELEATAEACRVHAPDSFAVVSDVSRREDAEAAVAEAISRLGTLDVVVNNAGISTRKHAADTTVEEIERVMGVNFLGAVYTTMAALPGMLARRRGSVVNVTSVAGYIPNPKESAYGASKAALSLWSHGLSVDLHATGVHVGVLSPGPIDTEIWGKDEVPASYDGPKFPPQVVADGVARMVEKELHHLTVPRRYGAVGIMYGLPGVGRAVRRGLIRYEDKGSAG
ncbi:MAG TPA: SDR family NAD(P)-dependent oxidoreductase [Acidimicrobiia bacterium]|nr:SDR family NAD(P)-dependent oxidoreductase [Acidimicrobiia bacterium]